MVLRGGSYLTHDHGFYPRKMSELQHRGGIATAGGSLDPTVAQGQLTTAKAMYRKMDMGFWLEKAEVAVKEVG